MIARAREDEALRATLVSRRPLPGVRAGSGLAWQGGRLAVVQDDAPAIALVDPRSASVEIVPLPGGGWDKRTKLDLEACVADGGRLVAFGSGSTPARERIAIVEKTARLVEASRFYGCLRRDPEFTGRELNVEGAVLLGDSLRLFNRGGVAAGDVAWRTLLDHLEAPRRVAPPPLERVVRWDLGRIDGVRLSFTDAAAAGSLVFFLAVAEDAPDAYEDGPVKGGVLGAFDGGGARFARLPLDGKNGQAAKAEGLAIDPDDPRRVFVVLDCDDPAVPAELCALRLDGPWPAP